MPRMPPRLRAGTSPICYPISLACAAACLPACPPISCALFPSPSFTIPVSSPPSPYLPASLPPPLCPCPQAGFDIIYEARDLDLPQNVRDGFTQIRTDLATAKARIAESEKRIDTTVAAFVDKQYW